jgi:Rrf2 family protein
MIHITRQTDYAIRILLALSRQPEGTRLASQTIGEEMLIPKAFLARIVAQLAQIGLVKTFPGRNGGLQLPRPAEEISLLDVVCAMEGQFLISECMTGEAACPFEENCPVRARWGRLQEVITKELESTSFAELALETMMFSGPVSVLPVNS